MGEQELFQAGRSRFGMWRDFVLSALVLRLVSAARSSGEDTGLGCSVTSPAGDGDIVSFRLLQQMRRIPGQGAIAASAPGGEIGESVMAVTSLVERPFAQSIGLDNHAGTTARRWQGNAQIAVLEEKI